MPPTSEADALNCEGELEGRKKTGWGSSRGAQRQPRGTVRVLGGVIIRVINLGPVCFMAPVALSAACQEAQSRLNSATINHDNRVK